MRVGSLVILLFCLAFGWQVAADPHPMGLREHRFNGSERPVTRGDVTTFTIRNHACSTVTYGDGRGEHDCRNGNVRSTLGAFTVPVGETWTYAFDFRVEAPLTYAGWWNSHASRYLDRSHDSRLRIAAWEGNRLHNFMYMLKVDGARGAYFLDETCVGADDLDEWHSFRMEVSWTRDDRGWIRVACDGRVIHFAEGIATTIGPHCYVTNLCRDAETKNPSRVLTVLGPVMQGFGPEWKQHGKASPFTDFANDITVRMRSVRFVRGGTLYDDAATAALRDLQRHLAALGCDPGPADGIMGARTRSAAMTCRDLGPQGVPDQLNAETVDAWLSSYRDSYPVAGNP